MKKNKFDWMYLGRNLLRWLIYSAISYMCLLPLQLIH